ncbi:hypothetical protein [Actinomadura terrae]|uniref:hypothetical protein n=1 Tax=Actinomadura terrae TaxID=604353 RepID=UPI001FA6B545|nr:hypothetical protein [Actinomadura terrae]
MNRFPARVLTTTAAVALGLGLAPAAALAAPAHPTTVQRTDLDRCGSHLDDWIDGRGAVYRGPLDKSGGGRPVEATVEVDRDHLVLTLDGNRGDPRPYEFEYGAIISDVTGFKVILDNPICKLATIVNETELTVAGPLEPPVYLKGRIYRGRR